jgi:hypothetical protein
MSALVKYDNLLGPLTEWRDVLRRHVLEKLDPIELALLSLTNRSVRAAVEESGLPVASGPAVCMYLAHKSDFGSLRRAHELGWPWNEWTCSELALQGRLNMLMWARENGCPWDSETMLAAARGGHLPTLIWAFENGAPPPRLSLAHDAVRGGHLHVMKWIHAEGLQFDVRDKCIIGSYHVLIDTAVKAGHTQTAAWLRGVVGWLKVPILQEVFCDILPRVW